MAHHDAADEPGRAALEAAERNVARFLDSAGVERVFGSPVEKGDRVLVPAAEVVAVMGFGGGSGGGRRGGEESGGGGGGGGGGRTLSRPVAVVVAGPDGVRVEPVVDVTKIALAALTAAGFVLAGLGRLRRLRRELEETPAG